MLQIAIWLTFKQLYGLSNQVLLGSLTNAIVIQQEHIVSALVKTGLLFKIAPNMLKGIANLTPVLWNLTGTVNHLLNLTHIHHFLLEILANILVNIAGMAQNKVFVFRPELLTEDTLVVVIYICHYTMITPETLPFLYHKHFED